MLKIFERHCKQLSQCFFTLVVETSRQVACQSVERTLPPGPLGAHLWKRPSIVKNPPFRLVPFGGGTSLNITGWSRATSGWTPLSCKRLCSWTSVIRGCEEELMIRNQEGSEQEEPRKFRGWLQRSRRSRPRGARRVLSAEGHRVCRVVRLERISYGRVRIRDR